MIALGLHTSHFFSSYVSLPMLCLAVRQEGKKQHSDAFGFGDGIGSVAVLGFGCTNVFSPKSLGPYLVLLQP